MSSPKIKYFYADQFLSQTYYKLPTYAKLSVQELSPCGFSLFWMSMRNFFVPPPEGIVPPLVSAQNQEDYLNLLVGIQSQKWLCLYKALKQEVEQLIINRYNIVYLQTNDDELYALSISSVFSNENDSFAKNRIMKIVNPLRKLYINKKKYNVECIGQNIIEDIELPDMEKHIPYENLPFTWITNLNKWLANLAEYDSRLNEWPEVIDEICETRKAISIANGRIIRGMDILYKNRDTKYLFSEETIAIMIIAYTRTSNLKFKLPKCAIDRFGIRSDNSVVVQESGQLILNESPQADSEFGIVFNNFCNFMSNYYSHLLKTDNLIIERLKKIKPSENSRLSLINLVSALEKICEVQMSFLSLVEQKHDDLVDAKDEKNRLLLLTSIWDYIYHHVFFKSRSLANQRRSFQQKYLESLSCLFEKELPTMEGVCKYLKVGNKVEITINDESVITTLFNEFKRRFPGAQTLSYEGYLFKSYLSELHITYVILEQSLPVNFVINANNFIIYESSEQFIKRLLPEDYDNTIMENTIVTAAIRCFSNIQQALPVIIKHSNQITNRLSTVDSTYLQTNVYSTWVTTVIENAIVPTIEGIRESLEYSLDFIPLEVCEEALEIYNVITPTLSAILNNPMEMIDCSSEEADQLISVLNDATTNFYNYIPTPY